MHINVKPGSSKQAKPQPKITPEAGRVAPIGTKPSSKKSATKGRRPAKRTVKAIINVAQRHQLISEAAYFKAEQRGFEGHDALQDWLDAESHIDSIYQVKD